MSSPSSSSTGSTKSRDSHKGEEDDDSWPTPSLSSEEIRTSYRIGRGEQGVLTFEPYKSILLPYWRFKTVPIARESCRMLTGAFEYYVRAGDFVGADMARKFIQMGMTRAGRYANRAGGRKYQAGATDAAGKKILLPKTDGHKGQEEKRKASDIFRAQWMKCKEDEEYCRLKQCWQQDMKAVKKESNEELKQEARESIKQEPTG